MNKRTFLPAWIIVVILGLVVVIAIVGFVIARQSNMDIQRVSQSLSTSQAAEQSMGSQVAFAESTAQAALRQQANAERSAREARNAQATAESAAQQRALIEALTVQEVQAAQEQAKLATSRWLAAEALNTLEQDPQLSAHLSLQAIEAGQTFEAENALHQVLPELRLLKSTSITDIIPKTDTKTYNDWSLAMGGELVITYTTEGIEVVNLVSGKHIVLAEGLSCDQISASADGRWLVVNCDIGVRMKNCRYETQIWEIETKTKLLSLDCQYFGVGVVPHSSTHPLLVFSRRFDEIIIWDGLSGNERFSFPSLAGNNREGPIASPDGNYLATYSDNGSVDLWDLIIGRKVAHFNSQSQIRSISFSPDGSHLATYDDSKQVVLWDLKTGQKVSQIDAQFIDSMTFSPDGTRLAITWWNKIQTWDLSLLSPKPAIQELSLDNSCSYPCVVIYSPDGQRLAVGSQDGPVKVWETKYGSLLLTLYGHSDTSRPVAFSQDGTRLYTASMDDTLKEWDISPGGPLMALPGRAGAVPYSPDGSQLALASEGGYVTIVDSQTGEVQLSWQAHSEWIGCCWYDDVSWSPDGTYLATFNSKDNAVKVWEASSGSLFLELPAEAYSIEGIAWSPNSKKIATIDSNTSSITIWDAVTGARLLTIEMYLKNSMGPKMDFSPDGGKLALIGSGCGSRIVGQYSCSYELVIWDTSNGNELFRFGSDAQGLVSEQGGKQKVLALIEKSFSANWISPIESEQYTHRFKPWFSYIGGHPSAVAFSPDGQHLVTGTPEGVISWMLTDTAIKQDQIFSTYIPGYDYDGLAFNPDGSLLVVAVDGKIQAWDFNTGGLRWELDGWGPVAFNPDGSRLVSYRNGITRIHILPLEELIDQVRSRIIRSMTPEECLAYLHEDSCPAWP